MNDEEKLEEYFRADRMRMVGAAIFIILWCVAAYFVLR